MICENCGKEHDGSYGTGRFCSSECAHSFVTKHEDKNSLKEVHCIDCGKIIYINKRGSTKNCRCDECKKLHVKPSNIRICKICGSEYLNDGTGGCKNSFCKNHKIGGFKTLIKYFTFDKSKLGTSGVEDEFNRVRDLLYNLYWDKELTAEEIGKLYNYKNAHNIIQGVFHFLNIPTRNLKESGVISYLHGKHDFPIKNQYKSCWHTTWNNKEVYLRSSYELDYAKYLDEQKIDYDVECLRIKYFDTQSNTYRCDVPDFYIPSTNTIVEIKSSWTLDEQNMKDKIKSYKDLGYNFNSNSCFYIY